MEFIALLAAKQIFSWAVRRELRRAGQSQHPAITGVGLVALELL